MNISTENTPANSMPRLMRIDEVQAATGIRSRSTLYLWMKQGHFPRPLAIGPKARAWNSAAIAGWIATRAAA